MNPKHFLELVLLAAIWGASFLFMRIASPAFGAENMAALRVVIAGITLLPVFALTAKKYLEPMPKDVKSQTIINLTLVSVGNSIIPFFLFAYATLTLEAGLTSVVNATTPLWGAFFGVILFGARLNKLGWLGLVIGLIGVVILTAHKLFDGQISNNTNDLLAITAVIGATGLYGIASNYSKHSLSSIPSLLVASGTMVIGALIVIPILMLNTNWAFLMSIELLPWLSLIGLGAICTGIAYLIFYRLVEQTSATTAMSVTYLIPMFGVFFGWIFLNEPIYINMFFGGVLILFGVMLTTGLIKRKQTLVKTC
ncbi:DMT family transporter [Psychrosphaera ytuae]|uniref:DMT family transporter n=1 Tax=Psychrosphaera ytuae TaxID=2820710 RepID=A0A975HJB3_9GAMM|nr:DMT family transporter [Psychrosphaera ytuae]QTH65053.1 DMT family transporter [Psychrosphaera ytuae]